MNVRDLVLASLNPKPVAVDIKGTPECPGWGTVYVRVLTAGEVMQAQEEQKQARGGEKPTVARFVCRTLCNDDGTRAFDVNNKEDVENIMAFPWTTVMEFVREANRVNGVDTAEKA
jgi:hypothetical protein